MHVSVFNSFQQVIDIFHVQNNFLTRPKAIMRAKNMFWLWLCSKALWANNNLSVAFFWVWSKNYSPNSHSLKFHYWGNSKVMFSLDIDQKVFHINLNRKLLVEINSIGIFKGFQIFGCEFWDWLSFKTQKKHMKIFVIPRDPRNSCVTNIFVCNK